MPTITRQYMAFYLEGRAERRLLKTDTDDLATEVAAQIVAGQALRDAITAAAQKAGQDFMTGRMRTTWLREHQDAILEAKVEPDKAYEAWLQGRVDELAYAMEEPTLEWIRDELETEEGSAVQ